MNRTSGLYLQPLSMVQRLGLGPRQPAKIVQTPAHLHTCNKIMNMCCRPLPFQASWLQLRGSS